jgi:hypothetical protein
MKLPLSAGSVSSSGCPHLHVDRRDLLGRGSLPSGYNWELRSICVELPLSAGSLSSSVWQHLHVDGRNLLGRVSLPSGYTLELLLSARGVLWGRLSFDARGMLRLGFSLYRPRVVAPIILFWSMLGDRP